ncbi:ANTAR domain-containing protein [Candidatus Micrarchaeota archaeon]|jgi:response regulator NasT|nr:ANTAR domain-containing protein [Candidatus Micrarchaeota archaeon]
MDTLEYCLAVPDPVDRRAVISALSLLGLSCVGEGSDSGHFLRVLRKVQPQLAILDLSLPGNVLETASIIDHEGLAALLLLEGKKNKKRVMNLQSAGFMILKMPVQQIVLNSVVEVLYLEFKRRQKLQQEISALRAKLQARTVVERAKGVLMQEFSWSEQQAYRFLQKESMDLRVPIKEVAEKLFKGNFSRNGEQK